MLEQELEEVRRNAEEADYQIELAREKVFCAAAEQTAQSFMEKLNDLGRMSHKLRFMAARHVRLRRKENRASNPPQMTYYGNETTRKIDMANSVIAACQENIIGDSDLRGNIKVWERISQAVTAYWSALRTNPDGNTRRGGIGAGGSDFADGFRTS